MEKYKRYFCKNDIFDPPQNKNKIHFIGWKILEYPPKSKKIKYYFF